MKKILKSNSPPLVFQPKQFLSTSSNNDFHVRTSLEEEDNTFEVELENLNDEGIFSMTRKFKHMLK